MQNNIIPNSIDRTSTVARTNEEKGKEKTTTGSLNKRRVIEKFIKTYLMIRIPR